MNFCRKLTRGAVTTANGFSNSATMLDNTTNGMLQLGPAARVSQKRDCSRLNAIWQRVFDERVTLDS